MNKGWICLHRKIQDSWVWDEKPFTHGQAWIDILMLANHEDKKFPLGNEIVTVEKGSFITSELKLMERWGWGKSRTRRFLQLLENDGMIIKKSDRQRTTIFVENYSDYQDPQTTNRPQTNQEQTNREPHADTNNNYNNYNNINSGVFIHNINNIKEPPTLPETEEDVLSGITEKWNAIPHTISIDKVVPMTRRYDELMICIDMVGIDGVLKAIDKVAESEYLKQRGNVAFDSYMNRNAIQKLLEGNYDQKFKSTEKPKNSFNNFEQRNYSKEQMDKILFG